ncbi:MAG: hypothetical protein PHX49_02510 [Bacteroidales bacterium]|jgi:hypothetical protein|nr:hypothetical protein [Bacteroidales bacterium]
MKKIFLAASILFSGIYLIGCQSDIAYDRLEGDKTNNLDTTTINEKAKDTVGIELFVSDKYLMLDNKEERFLYYSAKAGMLAVNSVLLPESDNPALPPDSLAFNASFENPGFVSACRLADVSDGNFFYGYTTASVLNDTSVVLMGEKRVNEKYTNDYSDNYVITQKTGSGKYVYNNVFRYAPYGVQYLYDTNPSVGTDGKQTIMAKTNTGLIVGHYDAVADTVNWDHYPKAFEALNDSNKSGARFYQLTPPQIAYNSKFGFMMFMGSQLDQATTKPGYILSIDPSTGVITEALRDWAPKYTQGYISSIDSSLITDRIPLLSNVIIYTFEDDTFAADSMGGLPAGSMLMFGYNKDKIYQSFYRYKAGDKISDIKFELGFLANVEGTTTKHSPVNIIINPYTQKIEMVHATPFLMELYSMSVADFVKPYATMVDSVMVSNLQAGRKKWNRECILLDRDISIRGTGMYPLGGIINMQRTAYSSYMSTVEKVAIEPDMPVRPGVQRIFFCCGDEYPARVAVFELTRSLDTPTFATWVNNKRTYIEAQSY